MQFIPSTWAMYGYDADGNGKADILNPTDAVFSAARYLCAAGAGRGGQSLDNAIFAYNHAWWYVKEVVQFANEYA
jgi:membrane-bound lytic murein transglycosylase B